MERSKIVMPIVPVPHYAPLPDYNGVTSLHAARTARDSTFTGFFNRPVVSRSARAKR